MAASKSIIATEDSGSPTPDTSTSFKILKARKSDGTVVTVKRRVLSSSHEDGSKKTATTSTLDPLTPIPEDKPAEVVPVGSKTSTSGVPKSDKPAKSSTKANRKARRAPKSNTKTATKASKTLYHSLRPFRFVFNKITSLWSAYESDLSDVGTIADDTDGSIDSDNDSLPSPDQGSTRSGTNSECFDHCHDAAQRGRS